MTSIFCAVSFFFICPTQPTAELFENPLLAAADPRLGEAQNPGDFDLSLLFPEDSFNEAKLRVGQPAQTGLQ